MNYTYTAHPIELGDMKEPSTLSGPLTHVVIATSWRGENPIAYTFSLEAAQAIADAFSALKNMDEDFLKEEA